MDSVDEMPSRAGGVMPEVTDTTNGVAIFVKAIHEKTDATGLEFGYRPNADGSEPQHGDRITCYAKATMPSGTVIEREASGFVVEKVMIDALADLARALGLRVRTRFVYDWEGRAND